MIRRAGFTLIEIIIVVAIIALASVATAPLGINFYQSQNITGIQSGLVEVLGRARSQSATQLNDSQYSLYMATSTSLSYTLFKGSDWATHVTTLDEPYQVPSGTTITFPGASTYIRFAKHTGLPTVATGTIRISRDGLVRTITLDDFGNVSTP